MEDEDNIMLDSSTHMSMNSNEDNATNNANAAEDAAQRKKASSSSPSSSSSKMISPKGVCRIEVTKVEWNPVQPWQRLSQSKSSGTGFCIEGQRLLTNAHVVKSAIDIRVRWFGSTQRFPAIVDVYAPEVDLAILKLTNPKDHHIAFFGTNNNGTKSGDDCGKEDQELTSPPTKRTKKSSSPVPGQQPSSSNSSSSSMEFEFATELPELQDVVRVVGYPTGGKTICVTEGVVSRIDVLNNGMLAIQVDSAINPGNSGGPALNSKGQVTGVAFRKRSSASGKKRVDNIGYLIPSVVVKAFLGRIKQRQQQQQGIITTNQNNTSTTPTTRSSTYTLAASIPFTWHSLENQSLRLAHQVPDAVHGILVTTVCETVVGADPDSLQKGDVITTIDGVSVADDGQVLLRGDELIQHTYLLKIKQYQEPLHVQVWRNGRQQHTCPPIFLRDIPAILPRWDDVDCQPNYLILGACVFLPFTTTLRHFKKCGSLLQADGIDWYRRWPEQWEDKQGLVILTDILAHELTFSYQRPWRRVTKYNGIPIQSLEHLRDLWEKSCEEVRTQQQQQQQQQGVAGGEVDDDTPMTAAAVAASPSPQFARLELENDDDLVFEVSAAIQAQSEVLKTYEIPKPYQILQPPEAFYSFS